MRELAIAYGNNRQAKKWVNKTTSFDELKENFETTFNPNYFTIDDDLEIITINKLKTGEKKFIKKKVEVFYRGKWIHASVIGTIKENRKAWNCSVLVEIGEEEALKRIQEQQ